MRKLAILALMAASAAAATLLVAGCGAPLAPAHCTANSDCTGDAVCAQNFCQQGFRLTAAATGDGTGRVTSSPDGIDCPGTCSAVFPAGASVTLRSIPDAASDFMGWTSGCSGTGDCTLTLDGAKSASASHKLVRIVFQSTRNVDGTDTPNANGTSNIWRVVADGSGATPLTRAIAAGAGSENPQWSPDGTQIVFDSARAITGADAANTNGVSNIWRVNADGTGLMPLTTVTAAGAVSVSPRWSPDGSAIVFVSNRNVDGTDSANANGTTNVWRIAASGNPATLTALTRNVGAGAGSQGPVWSRDGSKIAFTSTRAFNSDAANTNGTANVWRVNATGPATPVALTAMTASGVSSFAPQWSPDSTRIAFYSGRALNGTDNANANSTLNVWVINADGTDAKPLTNTTASGAGNFIPQWSNDGTHIVLASPRKPDGTDAPNATPLGFNLWSIRADGSGLVALTRNVTNAFNVFAVWSPSGSRLVFLSARKLDGTDALNTNSAFNIWRVGADGNGLVPLTTSTAAGVQNIFPAVAP